MIVPVVGSTTASYCIGPPTCSSGAPCRTRSVACRTLSTSGPDPEVPVEYDSIATRGSIPNFDAVSAELIAISANWSTVGSGTIAQSA